MLRKLVIAPAVLAAALAVTGCGSASKSAPKPPVMLTKAQFVTEANVVCGQSDPGLSLAGEQLLSASSTSQLQQIVTQKILPIVQQQIDGVRTVGLHYGDQASLTKMLTLIQGDVARLRKHPTLIEGDAFADFAKAAHAYGLTSCAPTS